MVRMGGWQVAPKHPAEWYKCFGDTCTDRFVWLAHTKMLFADSFLVMFTYLKISELQ